MTPRIASYTSSQYSCQDHKFTLIELGFSTESFSELIAVSLTPYGEEVITPLGLKLETPATLVARFFPGTRLYEKASYLTHLCLAQPRSVYPYYYAILRRPEIRPRMEPADTVPGYCIADYTLKLEAIVVKREKTGSGLLVARLAPILVKTRGPIAYTRAYGCSIEQLIALTRIRALAGRAGCSTLLRFFNVMLQSMDCILHSTTDTLLHKYGFEAVTEAARTLEAHGCPPPEHPPLG